MADNNYYQALQVRRTATAAEIEAAYEQHYNHWRRLVIHHDPDVVNQANQMLQALEQIRATLSDPKRRAAYDAGLEATGELALAQAGQMPSSAPGRPSTPAARPPGDEKRERIDAWVCPKCQTPNAIGSKHCRQCGQTIGVACPECKALVEAGGFCTSCGTDLPKAIRRQALKGEMARVRKSMDETTAFDPRRDEEIKHLRKATVAAGAWMGFGAAGFAAVVMGWRDFALSELHLPVLSGVMVALGIYAVCLLVLMIVRRASSASAFWATLGVLTTAGFPVLSFLFIEYLHGYGPDFTTAVLVARLALGLIALIAAMGLCGRLGRSGKWIWLLFLLILPAMVAAVLWDGWYLLYQIGEAPPLWEFIDLLTLAQVAGYTVVAVTFGLLALRGWWVTHHIEHEVAVALYKKETDLKAMQYQLRQFELELNALQKR